MIKLKNWKWQELLDLWSAMSLQVHVVSLLLHYITGIVTGTDQVFFKKIEILTMTHIDGYYLSNMVWLTSLGYITM